LANHPSLTIYDAEATEYLNTDFELIALDRECRFTEGPVWNPEGYYLFSDIPENVVYRLNPGHRKEVYLSPSGCTHNDREDLAEQIGSNGLAYDHRGELLLCQHGNHAVAKYNGEALVPFITGYGGRPFNSPNDIVCTTGGKIFFSDPPYGLKDQALRPDKYQDKAGFYCWYDGEVLLLTDQYRFPNGMCLSPDERLLYTCSSKPFENIVLEFEVESLRLNRELCRENSDGIKCDRYGNLYLATKEGVLMLNSRGKRLALIQLETIPANLCWGGVSGTDLFITARENIFFIPNLQKLG
jgi:gluconolactonase